MSMLHFTSHFGKEWRMRREAIMHFQKTKQLFAGGGASVPAMKVFTSAKSY